MNTLGEALKRANVKSTDFEDRPVNENEVQLDMEIDFMEKWLNLLKCHASDKEKHNFVTKHGYVSVQQFMMYLAYKGDAQALRAELDTERYRLSTLEIELFEKTIEEKEAIAKNIKSESSYKMYLWLSGKKDITPYGEDVSKM